MNNKAIPLCLGVRCPVTQRCHAACCMHLSCYCQCAAQPEPATKNGEGTEAVEAGVSDTLSKATAADAIVASLQVAA